MAQSTSEKLQSEISEFMKTDMDVYDSLLSCLIGTINPEKLQLQIHTLYPQEIADNSKIVGNYNASDDKFGDGLNKPVHWFAAQVEDIIRIHPELEDEVTRLVANQKKAVDKWNSLSKTKKDTTPFPRLTSKFLGMLNPTVQGEPIYVTYRESLIPTEEKLERAETSSKRNPKTGRYLTVNGYRIYGYKELAFTPSYSRIQHNREIEDLSKTLSLNSKSTEEDVQSIVYGILNEGNDRYMPEEDTVETLGQLSE